MRELARDERDLLLDGLDTEVVLLVRRARRVIALRATMVHPDLQPTSFVVLNVIHERGPLRASQVAEVFGFDKGAMSRVVQQLCELGLVTRETDPDDRRAQVISLTEAARERLAELVVQRRERLRGRLGDWEDAELEGFIQNLRHYNSALDWIDDTEISHLGL